MGFWVVEEFFWVVFWVVYSPFWVVFRVVFSSFGVSSMEIRIRLSIEDTVHCGEEGGSIRLEGGCEVFAIEAQFRGMRGDLLEAGAAFLH